MNRSRLALFSLVAVLASSTAAMAQESLISANSALLQQVKTAVLLQKVAAVNPAQAAAAAPKPVKNFELQHAWGRWTLWPNSNPSGLDIHVVVGDHVKLTVTNVDTPNSSGFTLVINGLKIREWIQPGDSYVVEFDAAHEALYQIEGIGLIVVQKK
jgi:hypothetical protein